MPSDTWLFIQKGSPLHQEAFKYAEGVASDLSSNDLTREGRRKDVVMWVIVMTKNPLRDHTA